MTFITYLGEVNKKNLNLIAFYKSNTILVDHEALLGFLQRVELSIIIFCTINVDGAV
jgi:hypothetical protein